MATEEAKTESQIQDKRALALQNLKDTIVASQDECDARAFDEMSDVLKTATGQTTAEQRNVIDAAEAVAPELKVKRAYGSAGRTLPAQLTEARYRCLPKWQQEFRNPDDDMIVARYFRALGTNDHDAMRRLMAEDRHQRAGDLLEGDSAAGAPFDGSAGQLLPLPVANFIHIALYRMARWRQLVNTNTATTGTSLRFPIQSAISTSSWEGETDLIAAGEGAVANELNLRLKKLATLATLSNEILEDEVFGIASWLTEDVVQQMAETEDAALYATGTGADQPAGFELNDIIITATTDNTNIVPTVTQAANHFLTTVIDEDNVTELFFSIGEKERTQAIWTGNDSVMQTLTKIKDGGGRPLFAVQNDAARIVGDSPSGATIGSIYGRPVWNLPGAVGTTDSNDNRLYFLNPRRTYAILEKASMRVESSRETLFSTDMTVFKFVRRLDGGVIGNTIAGRRQYAFLGGITGAGTPA